MVRIAETKEGFLDLNDLERKLVEEKSSERMMVGCFNAASCITGVLADDVATTLLLHQYGALSVWDYTSAGEFVILVLLLILLLFYQSIIPIFY